MTGESGFRCSIADGILALSEGSEEDKAEGFA